MGTEPQLGKWTNTKIERNYVFLNVTDWCRNAWQCLEMDINCCKELSQLYGCSRQCSRPVLARCSMGFGPNPLSNKQFNSAYLQIKYLIFIKIHSNTLWLDKTFIFSSQVTIMFQIFFFFKKKYQSEIFNCGPSCQPRQAKKKVALKKSLRLHTRRTPAAAMEQVY